MLTDDQLLELLRGGESDRAEFTSEYDEVKVRRNVCAFSNDLPGHGRPGVVFIGANDDGSCAGMRVTDDLLLKLSELSRNAKILPFPTVTVGKKTLDECEMAVVSVAPSHSPPVFYDKDCWVRVGPSCRKATREEEAMLVERRRGQPTTFDTVPAIPRAGIEDLDIGVFHEYLRKAVSKEALAENERTDEERLKSMGFMSPDGGVNFAGLLCFGENPQKWLGGAFVQFARFPGTDIVSAAETVDHKEFRGTIFAQLRDIESLMHAHIQVPAIIGSPTRVDFPFYPEVALQQAIRNAVLHRAYEGTNAPVQCYWFSDRVEIRSPGGPYGRVTIAKFGDPDLTDYRNLQLAAAMRAMVLIERFGFGIGAIRRSMAGNGNPPPEFRVDETNVTVVLRKLDLGALVAKAAELACCQALFRFKRGLDSNTEDFIDISAVLSPDPDIPGFSGQAFSMKIDSTTPKETAFAALRAYTARSRTSKTTFSPRVPMARIMHLLRELFGAEESEMRKKFEGSFVFHNSGEEQAQKEDENEFRRLSESPPALSQMEADINREAEEDRMRALISRS